MDDGDDAPHPDCDALVALDIPRVKIPNIIKAIDDSHQDSIAIREWFVHSLPSYGYFTVVTYDDEDKPQWKVFQLLSRPAKIIVVETFDHKEERVPKTWSVRTLGIFNETALPSEPGTLDVFRVHDSSKIDIVDLLGCRIEMRQSVLVWQSRPSELADCTQLYDPSSPTPTIGIDNPKYPLLGLLDSLSHAGWAAVQRQVVHTRSSGQLYCAHASRNRWYLRCEGHAQNKK